MEIRVKCSIIIIINAPLLGAIIGGYQKYVHNNYIWGGISTMGGELERDFSTNGGELESELSTLNGENNKKNETFFLFFRIMGY